MFFYKTGPQASRILANDPPGVETPPWPPGAYSWYTIGEPESDVFE